MTFPRTRCKHCKGKLDLGQRILHPACIDDFAVAEAARMERKKAKEARAAAKVEKAETRRRKEAIKTIPALIREAQVAFNAWVRARDAILPCICCGKPFEPMKPGGSVDAGHFRSRGAAGHLRFNEDNCFAQRKNCNRPGGTTYAAFRAGVVARIGEARVTALEADNTPHKWDRDELISIRNFYRGRLKEIRSNKDVL